MNGSPPHGPVPVPAISGAGGPPRTPPGASGRADTPTSRRRRNGSPHEFALPVGLVALTPEEVDRVLGLLDLTAAILGDSIRVAEVCYGTPTPGERVQIAREWPLL